MAMFLELEKSISRRPLNIMLTVVFYLNSFENFQKKSSGHHNWIFNYSPEQTPTEIRDELLE